MHLIPFILVSMPLSFIPGISLKNYKLSVPGENGRRAHGQPANKKTPKNNPIKTIRNPGNKAMGVLVSVLVWEGHGFGNHEPVTS